MKALRSLKQKEIDLLQQNGCTAENWDSLQVASDFDVSRVRQTHFFGKISVGRNTGFMSVDGLPHPCGISHATIANCQIGDNVLISNVGSAISDYVIEDDVVIEDISLLLAEPDARYGSGVKVSALNEAGGREVTLFEDLTAQIAYMQAMFKHDVAFQEKLQSLIEKRIQSTTLQKGRIAKGARLRHCRVIKNVMVGEHAELDGASELSNGTICSCPEHPTRVGAGVIAKNFIISEGAELADGTNLERVFVGQATRIGKQFTAENSVFFANCEGFQSEVCSVFAGPYSVTHHKSTLLIAAMVSFYNAGSGTNQSNHMYKLGPVHQGILERGCKTGSFAYLLFESHIAPFTVVIGKHMVNINIPHLPFSYLLDDHGQSKLLPAVNLISVGTARDAVKWPSRDRRKAENKRDLITFDVFSPYVVEKMRQGRDHLQELYEKTPQEETAVLTGGVQISRLLLRKGAKYYGLAIEQYLLGKVITKVEKLSTTASTWDELQRQLAPSELLAEPQRWTDVGGLLTASSRIDRIVEDVANDWITHFEELLKALQSISERYGEDEWCYVFYAFEKEYGFKLTDISVDSLAELIGKWESSALSLQGLIVEDSKKEFSEFSQIGYGLDQPTDRKQSDFVAVRGTVETNSVVQNLEREKGEIKEKAKRLLHAIDRFR